ncbi:MAG TPA: acyl-CoA dehydrogenase family protein [Acidobacteriota bacterium]|nr:acyl-CoA dehydrogenase family protein [Acidobacteriota bacterium]
MDFSIPDSMQTLLCDVRAFLDERLLPLEDRFRTGAFANLETDLQAVREEVRSQGWWLPQIHREWGGMGLSCLDFGLLGGVLGRSPLGHYAFNCQAPDAGNMEILISQADDAQKESFLKPLLEGRTRSCFAMTEPDQAGSNPVWMSTQARPEDGGWVLNGRKWYATGADGAAFAVVMAVTDADADPHQRASMFLVPTDAPGYRLARNISVMGHEGDGWASHGEVALENCRVPQDALLGQAGQGFAIAQERLGPGRIHHCMRWIGICERAFELMVGRAATRCFAPGKPLATRQMVQDAIATSRMEINSARLSVLHAAWTIDQKGTKAARQEISCIKFQVAGVMQRVLDRAIQLHGGLGVSDDTPLAWFWRHERASRIYDGPDEVHKIAVAKQVLKEYQASSSKSGLAVGEP